ncbi:MAG TPA: MGMT family protein [Gammaproteobacteria bacterium]|nr:MGMT family protein [Gammaproteobacteria bacterium]
MSLKKPTEFQKKVWSTIDKIPHGKTITYKELAISIGRPNAYRAVANACGKNPNPVSTPCHRVVSSSGKIGGYSGSGGIEKKKALLKKEGVIFD